MLIIGLTNLPANTIEGNICWDQEKIFCAGMIHGWL